MPFLAVSFDNETATGDSTIASLFNSYFHSIFTPGPDLSQYQFSLSEPSVVLEDFDITVHDVFIHLRSLDPSKATGIDVIPAAFLKYCATTLCEPIHHLLDHCLAQSYLPTEWRTHMVTPL